MVTQCSYGATARKARDIYPFRFIAVASRGYKNWLQFEQHYSHSVFKFYFFGKKVRRQMSWNVLKLDLNSARWKPEWVSSYVALTSKSLRATIGPLQDNWPLSSHRNLRNLTLQQETWSQLRSMKAKAGEYPTSFPGSSLYLEKVPWLRPVTCLCMPTKATQYVFI